MATDVQKLWAKLGANARLAEINQERAAIFKAFPDLRKGAKSVEVRADGKPKRRFSEAAKARMSAGMRKYWAKRRAAKAAKKA
jgi:hypothetical protein